MSRDTFHQPRVLRAPSNLALNTAREGAATASLGNLGQCLTTLMEKNFFLISHLNLPSFSTEPFPLVPSLHSLVKSPSPSFLQAPSGTGSCSKAQSLLSASLGDGLRQESRSHRPRVTKVPARAQPWQKTPTILTQTGRKRRSCEPQGHGGALPQLRQHPGCPAAGTEASPPASPPSGEEAPSFSLSRSVWPSTSPVATKMILAQGWWWLRQWWAAVDSLVALPA